MRTYYAIKNTVIMSENHSRCYDECSEWEPVFYNIEAGSTITIEATNEGDEEPRVTVNGTPFSYVGRNPSVRKEDVVEIE